MKWHCLQGTCGALVCVSSSDTDNEQPKTGNIDETFTFNTVLGTTYYLMIQGCSSTAVFL